MKNKEKYEEAGALNSVAAFHRLFRLPIVEDPAIPTKDRCQLRINLIREELEELEEALDQMDLTEVADACADLQYVLSGAIIEFGLADRFAALFAEVQRSNMSKACLTASEALQTVEYYKNKDGTEAYIEQVGEQYLVYRRHDKKVLKSINYSPADIAKFL